MVTTSSHFRRAFHATLAGGTIAPWVAIAELQLAVETAMEAWTWMVRAILDATPAVAKPLHLQEAGAPAGSGGDNGPGMKCFQPDAGQAACGGFCAAGIGAGKEHLGCVTLSSHSFGVMSGTPEKTVTSAAEGRRCDATLECILMLGKTLSI